MNILYLNHSAKFIGNGEKCGFNFCAIINDTEGSYEYSTNKIYWEKGKNSSEALIETSFSAMGRGSLLGVI